MDLWLPVMRALREMQMALGEAESPENEKGFSLWGCNGGRSDILRLYAVQLWAGLSVVRL